MARSATQWKRIGMASAIVFVMGCEGPGDAPHQEGPVVSEPELRLGGSDQSGIVFGEVQDVAFLPTGEVLVLDRMNSVLLAFDTAGHVVNQVGSEGEGPGEWLYASSVDASDVGVVRVLSQGLSRIHSYQMRGQELVLVEETRLPFLPRDLCTLKERIFVLGLNRGLSIHELGEGGDVVSSFGPLVERPPELLGEWASVTAEWAADGRLLCDREHGLVIHAPLKLPDVTAYDPSGEIAWRISLEGYSQGRWERIPGGPIRTAADPETGQASGLASLASLSSGGVLVQFSNFRRPGSADTPVEVVSRVYDAGSGAPCRIPFQLPQILAVLGSRAAWAGESLIPEVRVGRLEGGACETGPAI